MPLGARAWLLFLSASTAGCNLNNICGTTQQDVLHPDGGFYGCIASEDCPRPSNVFVCVTNTAPDKECVRCSSERRCVRIKPEFCKQ